MIQERFGNDIIAGIPRILKFNDLVIFLIERVAEVILLGIVYEWLFNIHCFMTFFIKLLLNKP